MGSSALLTCPVVQISPDGVVSGYGDPNDPVVYNGMKFAATLWKAVNRQLRPVPPSNFILRLV